MRVCTKFAIILITFVCMLTGNVNAQETQYELGTFQIPYMVIDKNTGAFIDLVEEIGKHTGKTFKIEIMSPKRIFLQFEENKILGMFPGTESRIKKFKSAVKSEPFYIKRDVIFSRKESVFRNIKSLEGKKVGLTSGYAYSENLTSNPKIFFEYPESDITGFNMLEKRRIDAFIAEEISGLKAIESCNCKNITYEPDFSVSSQKVYFVFQSTEVGKSLAEDFSSAIIKIKQDGTLKKIFNVSDQWIKSLSEK